ncbi:ABC transporter substrate-binding protein [Methylobacterium brachiatum]|uniref:Peptide/nickel transport system substrate-binding protein n=1 Tax=Methylobacterium brachiatum TaxID=269660 RepID=A0AAJ1WWB0_9HYPH|nr:ABC transporter substrate-binding protein [Methylobacterium brachiatum]MCB4803376.1 ABC transporter substrate-binding protein [Methylobacterium brachiatum]MDQ0544107.1 peptide/nickel transport system substrate-binding protein [Methylobacterium brachiatum]SFI45577.1 peptide/nickel transport system substrate-binding protein [Methylobacterium brachiatum]
MSRSTLKILARGVAAGAVAAFALTALPAQAANVFRFAFQGDIKSLDPYSLKESFTIGMHGAVYESLITRDKDLKLAPQLAESWETPEPTRWRFHLRKGVKFHDGSPFTADDVIFSAQRVRAPGSNFQTNVPGDAEFVKVDDYTVDMLLKKPNPIAVYQFSGWYIMSKSWSEKNNATQPTPPTAAAPSYATLHENGTGPFVITEHQPGVKTVFKKFDGYWGKVESNLDEAVFTTIGNDATRVAALLSGEVDWVDPVSLQDQQRVNSSGTATVMAGPELRTVFLGMDQWRDELKDSSVKGKNPFKDPKVREAFYRAIDEDTIAKRVMRGQATPSALLIAPTLFDRANEIKRPATDLKRAKELMVEAGYPDGFSLTMDCPNDRYVNDEAICQAVVSMLARINVKVNLNAQPKAKYFAKVLSPGFDTSFYLVGWTPSSQDSHNILFEIAGCRKPGDKSGRGGWNLGGYCNPKIDTIADQVEAETDKTKRDALIKEGFDTIQADWGYIPLHQQALAWGVSKKVHLVQRPDNMLLLYWVSKDPQ